ncbi:hypothetical protein BC940DRAFT_361570 [Gongronella butleri]|nr:hypothetical protein BC940DRAFT_361570 [Gongronella butleri]
MRLLNILIVVIALLCSFSVDAYLLKSPNNNVSWQSYRPGRITWTRVETDASAFAVKLTRAQPPYDALIYRHIGGGSPGQDHSYDIPPPKGGFPVGDHFRLNLVDVHNHGIIHAQSNEFTIHR